MGPISVHAKAALTQGRKDIEGHLNVWLSCFRRARCDFSHYMQIVSVCVRPKISISLVNLISHSFKPKENNLDSIASALLVYRVIACSLSMLV